MLALYFLLINYPALKLVLENEELLSKLLLYQQKINHIIELTPDHFRYKNDLVQISALINSHHYMWYSEHIILILVMFIVFSVYDPIPLFKEIALIYPPDDWQIILLFVYLFYLGFYADHSLAFIAMFVKVYNNCDADELEAFQALLPCLERLEDALLNNTLSLEETTQLYVAIIDVLKLFDSLLYALPIS